MIEKQDYQVEFDKHEPLSELTAEKSLIGVEDVQFISEALYDMDRKAIFHYIEPFHKADIADLIEQLPSDQRVEFVRVLGQKFDPEILNCLDDDIREKLINNLDVQSLAKAVEKLESDEAVDIIEDLEEESKQQLYQFISEKNRLLIEEALSFPDESAGRMMHREIVVLPSFWTVGDTIDFLRQESALPDNFYEIFVVDAKFQPVGVLHLSTILKNKRSLCIADLMSKKYYPVSANMDREVVADMFRQYRLVSAPVVNDEGRLVGEITVDDIFPVIDEEADEDLMKMAGVSDDNLYGAAFYTARTRFSWLLINLATAILASIVIAFFEATIEKVVALAVLMPIVASMGGNAGTQTLAVSVRALATKRINNRNAFKIVTKETLVGFFNGIAFSLLVGLVSWLWFSDKVIAFVIAISMIINMIVAGIFGLIIPLALQKYKIDPAVASPVILTTVTDIVGFFSFLGLAAWIII